MKKYLDLLLYNQRVKNSATFIFLSLVILFLAFFFRDIDLDGIRTIRINYFWLINAVSLMVLARFLFPFVWIFLLAEFGQHIQGYRELCFIYAKSWLGKYIPGNVMTITGKIVFGVQAGYDKKALTIVAFLETFIQAVSGLMSGLLIVGLVNFGLIDKRIAFFALLAGIILLISILPPVFNRIITIAYRIIRKQPLPSKYHYKTSTLIKTLVLFFLVSILPAIATSVLGYSIYPDFDVLKSLVFMIGVLNLAGALGLIAIFAPGGLGVREGVLAVFLYTLFPKETLLVFIVLIRLTAVVADILFFFIAWVLQYLTHRSI